MDRQARVDPDGRRLGASIAWVVGDCHLLSCDDRAGAALPALKLWRSKNSLQKSEAAEDGLDAHVAGC